MTLLPGDVLLTGTPEGWGGRRRRRRRGGGRRDRDPSERGARVTVRCRFAPAPSGSIHVGNARSAVLGLHARHSGGVFTLRVEDTDASRVTEEAYLGVLEDLRWLGIAWDEGPDIGGLHRPYRQSGWTSTARRRSGLSPTATPIGAGARPRSWTNGGRPRSRGASRPGTTAGAGRVRPRRSRRSRPRATVRDPVPDAGARVGDP